MGCMRDGGAQLRNPSSGRSESHARRKFCRFDPTVEQIPGRIFSKVLTTSSQPPAIGNWLVGVSGL